MYFFLKLKNQIAISGKYICSTSEKCCLSSSILDLPPISHSISVGEASNRVTVIHAGDNARIDINRDNELPDEIHNK